ncbi:MAG: DNA-binding transcriptional LysR family regulator [Gammaproteobacteria bacterium]|jgi:DNA-binding transcriptional LysR family regulator
MSVAQLKAFHALALSGSVQKASELIHVTQPAISIHVRRLESDHGKQLFRRGGHQFQLTRDGELLLEATRRLFRAEQDSQLILSGRDQPYSGHLVVGADGPHIALSLIEKFQLSHPRIKIDVRLENARATWLNLINLNVDVAILAGAPAHRDMQRQIVSRQRSIALTPINSPIADLSGITLNKLRALPIIFREKGSHTQSIIESALTSRKLTIDPVMTLGSREAVVEAVARGIGTGFIFESELGRDHRYKGIPISDIKTINIDELVCLKQQRSNPIVAALFQVAFVMLNPD